ncbi:MAG: GAF domain-containing protein [Anaerolineae bacterium]|nr:GAF domain-containing protein [Anaerolineae bacterium]
MAETSRTTLELLFNISRELTADLDLRTVLARVLTLSSTYVGAERASIVVLDNGKPVEAAIYVDELLKSHTVDQWSGILDQGLAGWVTRNKTAVLVPDTRLDERWLQRPDDSDDQTGGKSAICAPVIARDQMVGVLTIVHSTPNTFNEEHLALVQAIGDQAGGAIVNARLYTSLETAHRRYVELFDDSIDPIWITDLNGLVIEANRQAGVLTGRSSDEMHGERIHRALYLPESWLNEQFPDIQAGRTSHIETTLQSQNGGAIPVEAYVRWVTVDSGAVMQWILRDISERTALDGLRDDLMAMVYHDLRSPLSNIISSLEMMNLLLPPPGENDNLRVILNIATRSSDRMQRLIATLLDIYRLEAGQPISNRKPAEILPLIIEAVDAIQPVLESKGQNMKVDIENSLPAIPIDADMIRRVLINLLDNATKFTPLQGDIGVRVHRDGEMIVFTISDNGPGIPPDKTELIFDKFARLQVDRIPKGLGLGLAFCKLAVRSHGGKIWVESKVNSGSIFNFSLPVG